MQTIRQRRAARIIWGGVLLLALFLTGCEGTHAASNGSPSRSASGLQGTDLGAKPAPAFQLMDQNRQAISLTQFIGMPVVVTFFYTHCTTSCPLIANKIHMALVQLGSAAQHVAILAISVDPSGDTPASATTFARAHHLQGYQHWHYLLGTRLELTPIWAVYDVTGIPPGASMMSQSVMNHSAIVYLLDVQGRERVLLDSDFTADTACRGPASLAIRPLLRGQPGLLSIWYPVGEQETLVASKRSMVYQDTMVDQRSPLADRLAHP